MNPCKRVQHGKDQLFMDNPLVRILTAHPKALLDQDQRPIAWQHGSTICTGEQCAYDLFTFASPDSGLLVGAGWTI